MSWRDRNWADDGGTFTPSGRPVATLWILGITVGFSLIVWILGGGSRGTGTDTVLNLLQLEPAQPWEIWRLVTYALCHAGVGHLIGNVFMIAIAGWIMENYFGRKLFVMIYLGLVAFAALGAVVDHFFFGAARPVIGASGGALGLIVLLGTRFPKLTLLIWGIIPMQAWVLASILVFLDLLQIASSGGNTGTAHSVHLAGALGGFLFGFVGPRMGMWRDNAVETRDRKRAERVRRDVEDERLELDRVLEKINTSGMDQLSEREKQFLVKQSKKLKDSDRR